MVGIAANVNLVLDLNERLHYRPITRKLIRLNEQSSSPTGPRRSAATRRKVNKCRKSTHHWRTTFASTLPPPYSGENNSIACATSHLHSHHDAGHRRPDRANGSLIRFAAGSDASSDRLVLDAHDSRLPVQLESHLRSSAIAGRLSTFF